MNNKVDERVSDLSYDIIKDSKRRSLYYDEKTKKGYQIHPKDVKWIRLYKLRFFFSLFIYFLIFMSMRNQNIETKFALSLGTSVLLYFAITLLFEKLFFKDKVPFRIAQKDFDQRFEPAVLKQKRMLQRFHLAFVVIYGLLALIDLYTAQANMWIMGLTVIIVIGFIIYFIQRLLSLREQIRISEKKDEA